MGFLDNVTFEEDIEKPRPKKSIDKREMLINKFEDYLTKQKAALKTLDKTPDTSQKRGKGKRPKAHTYWHEEKEKWIFVPRYGTKKITLKVGDNGKVYRQVSAPSLDEMAATIDSLINATKSGVFDTALAEAAARPRKSAAGSGDGNQPTQSDPASDTKPADPAPDPKPADPAPPIPAPAPSGTSTRKGRS